MSRTRITVLPNTSVTIGVFVALSTVVIAFVMLHYTRFGRTVYAIGGSEQSAVLMGLPVPRTKIAVYVISGFCASLGGMLFTNLVGRLVTHVSYSPVFVIMGCMHPVALFLIWRAVASARRKKSPREETVFASG